MNPFLLEKVHGDQDYLELFLGELPGCCGRCGKRRNKNTSAGSQRSLDGAG